MTVLSYPWWLASRAAGITAYVLLSASVGAGLMLALRRGARRWRGALRIAHERLSLLALAFVGAHGLLLTADGWLRASLSQILIPFTLPYRPFWTGVGILAAYVAAALSLTYYARRLVGARRWRHAHRFIPVAWAMAVVHVVGAGTDARSAWLLAPIGLTVAPLAWLLADRWLADRHPAPRRRAPAASPSADEVVQLRDRVPVAVGRGDAEHLVGDDLRRR